MKKPENVIPMTPEQELYYWKQEVIRANHRAGELATELATAQQKVLDAEPELEIHKALITVYFEALRDIEGCHPADAFWCNGRAGEAISRAEEMENAWIEKQEKEGRQCGSPKGVTVELVDAGGPEPLVIKHPVAAKVVDWRPVSNEESTHRE